MHLYMTELRVSDWERSLYWYRDALGLTVEMLDERRKFALLGGEGSRIALKQGDGGSPNVRLSFLTDDLDAARIRLMGHGSSCSPIEEDPAEPFVSFRLVDPDGTPIQVFGWTE